VGELRDLILKALLSNGYFPKELPPVFTTKDFGSHADAILQDWHAAKVFEIKGAKDFGKIGGKKFRSKYSYKKIPSADPEVISKPKKLYERRNIHVTTQFRKRCSHGSLQRTGPKFRNGFQGKNTPKTKSMFQIDTSEQSRE